MAWLLKLRQQNKHKVLSVEYNVAKIYDVCVGVCVAREGAKSHLSEPTAISAYCQEARRAVSAALVVAAAS